MATPFRQVWANASAGTIEVSASTDAFPTRQFLFCQGEMTGLGTLMIWTTDGEAGSTLALVQDGCPWVSVLAADRVDQGALSAMGSFGPISEPHSTMGSELYMWRTEWDTTNTEWRTTIYSGAPDGSGYLDSSSKGRGFYAHALNADP
jgi:hypothetical protein